MSTRLLLLLWSLAVAISLAWNLQVYFYHQKQLFTGTGRTLARQLELIRHWNVNHGRVYAPVSETHRPSVFLKDPNRDVKTTDGTLLTKVSSAIMVRQLSELSQKESGLKFRSNSLNPINPVNLAHDWEAIALKKFDKDLNDWVDFYKTATEGWELRYMAPSIALKQCVTCHSEKGFKEGDVLGGFSIRVPVNLDFVGIHLWISHAAVLFLGLFGISSFRKKLLQSYKTIVETQNSLEEKNQILNKLNQEMKSDLMVAEELQKKLFTDFSTPAFLDMYTVFKPFSHVSGDIFNIKEQPDGSVSIFIGDGTGHGIAAAFTTIMARVGLSQKAEEKSAIDLLKHLNTLLEEHLPDDRYMSAIFANVNPEGLLITANAGHPPLVIITSNGEIKRLKNAGLLLGLFSSENLELTLEQYQLMPGDRVFVYTDGITERKNRKNEMFGPLRFEKCLQSNNSEGIEKQIHCLLEEVEKFSESVEPDDDITMIGFKFKVPPDSSS